MSLVESAQGSLSGNSALLLNEIQLHKLKHKGKKNKVVQISTIIKCYERCSEAKSRKTVLISGDFESRILTLNASIKSKMTAALSLSEFKFQINS